MKKVGLVCFVLLCIGIYVLAYAAIRVELLHTRLSVGKRQIYRVVEFYQPPDAKGLALPDSVGLRYFDGKKLIAERIYVPSKTQR